MNMLEACQCYGLWCVQSIDGISRKLLTMLCANTYLVTSVNYTYILEATIVHTVHVMNFPNSHIIWRDNFAQILILLGLLMWELHVFRAVCRHVDTDIHMYLPKRSNYMVQTTHGLQACCYVLFPYYSPAA